MHLLWPGAKHIFEDAKTWRRLHGGLFFVWVLLIVPTFLWWMESIKWIVFMSLYAIIVSHVGAWQGARAEDSD